MPPVHASHHRGTGTVLMSAVLLPPKEPPAVANIRAAELVRGSSRSLSGLYPLQVL